jgi:hypothetical protein
MGVQLQVTHVHVEFGKMTGNSTYTITDGDLRQRRPTHEEKRMVAVEERL